MKRLRCPECKTTNVLPPLAGKRKWRCAECGEKFRLSGKDAGKIMRRADERGEDLGALEPFLISAMLEKTKKRAKSTKSAKSRAKKTQDAR